MKDIDNYKKKYRIINFSLNYHFFIKKKQFIYKTYIDRALQKK